MTQRAAHCATDHFARARAAGTQSREGSARLDRAVSSRTASRHVRDQTFLDIAVTNGDQWPRPMTNAERQRRYIARLKKAAVSNGGDAGLAKELAQAKAKIAELEDELARTKLRLKLAKAGLK